MKQRLRYIVYILLFTCISSAAWSQNLSSEEPDVIFECFRDNKPNDTCNLTCGLGPTSSPGAGITWTNVDRVELFDRNATSYSGGRMWIFVRSKSSQTGRPSTIALNVGPAMNCLFSLRSYAEETPEVLDELRMTKFRVKRD
jgi:hypothetical protein